MSSTPATDRDTRPSGLTSGRRYGDAIFNALSFSSGFVILLVLIGVTFFLFWGAKDALLADPSEVRGQSGLVAYVGPLIFGTLLSSVIALAIAVPLSIGIALFISHYAPRRLASGLGYVVDLLAAVPSIIFGLWGMQIAGGAVPAFEFLFNTLGFIPLFSGESVTTTGRTMLMIGIVLAIMILPIMTAVNREVFLQVRSSQGCMNSSAVTQVVARNAARAGLGTVRAHRLRHSAARAVLAGGGTLAEVGELLGHRTAEVTMVYASFDLSSLRALVRPWPVEVDDA